MPSASETIATTVKAGDWPELTNCVAEIAGHFVEQPQAERLTNVFLARTDAAKLDAGPAARLRDRNTRSNQIVGVLIDVKAKLVVHLLLERRAVKKRATPRSAAGP